jgi:hypothetical protein
MYQNTTSSIQINGHTTSKIPINCSVRHGCPLSMMLFSICIDPLVRTLTDNSQDIDFESSGTHSAELAYADDVTILLQPQETYIRYKKTLDQYGATTGAQINIRKSKALTVEKWDTTVNIMSIQYQESVKILGIHFTKSILQTAQKSWLTVTNGIRAHAQETYSRKLNLHHASNTSTTSC